MTLLSEQEIQTRLKTLQGWGVEEKEIVKKYVFRDFLQAMAFAVKAGMLAEAADHHPDILIHGYKRVTLRLTTHSEGGLTGKDFKLASQIDTLAI